MWDQTHNETANGWAAGGESSFVTERKPDSRASSIGDRLPVPATISMLRERLDEGDDKYVLGQYRFSTIITVGIVKDIQENGATYTYLLGDPNHLEVEFSVAKFMGDTSRRFDASSIVEGTRVRAIGKLKTFNGTSSIMCFVIDAMEDDKDFKVFELEAKASLLYFRKDFPAVMRNPSVNSQFTGMLAPPKNRQVAAAPQSSASSQRIFKQDAKLDDMGAKIRSVLSAIPQDDRETGQEVRWIMEQIGATDEAKVRAKLMELVERGEAYNTTDEDHYSGI